MKLHPFLRQETIHIVETVAFEIAKLKILGENDQKYFTQTELKKGEKYQIQMDLEEELTSNCQECMLEISKKLTFFEKFWTFIEISSKILG